MAEAGEGAVGSRLAETRKAIGNSRIWKIGLSVHCYKGKYERPGLPPPPSLATAPVPVESTAVAAGAAAAAWATRLAWENESSPANATTGDGQSANPRTWFIALEKVGDRRLCELELGRKRAYRQY